MPKLFLLLFCITVSTAIFSQQIIEPTAVPDRVMLTIPGDPATTAAVTWRTLFSDTVSIAQITEASPSPNPEKESDTVRGTISPWEKNSNQAMGHRVIFRDLKPETGYIYRVGNGTIWSEWHTFTTSSDKPEPFSFIYLGDVQNDITSQGSRVIREAYTHFPDAAFILFAGDLVDRSYDERWHQFFIAGGWIFATMPSLPTPGNHEYNTDPKNNTRLFSDHWQQIFTLPENGPSSVFRSRVYYTDYQGVRLISLDSPALGYNQEDKEMIISWLEKTLASNPNRWTILFTHYPIYSCSQGRDSESYRDLVKPLLEKYGVDLVLQGHDHTYCRGQNIPMAGGVYRNLPVYVVSVAGPKMYGLNSSLWADRVASETQLYQNISIENNRLIYRSYSADGRLYDGFKITKSKKGSNRFSGLAEIKDINERVTIPESRRASYKPEEIEKIENRMKRE